MSVKSGLCADDLSIALLQDAIEKAKSLKVINDTKRLDGLLEDLEKLKAELRPSHRFDEQIIEKLLYPIYLELLKYLIQHFL